MAATAVFANWERNMTLRPLLTSKENWNNEKTMQWNQKLKIYKHSKKIEGSVKINLFLKKIEYDD